MTRRAGVLLEVMLALALLVAAGIVILSTLDRSAAGLKAARDQLYAADLARSAMAKIEAGIENAQSLNGPVPAWSEPTDTLGSNDTAGEFEDDLPPPSGWELDIKTEPSVHEGLTLVTVNAVRRSPGPGQREVASYTLCQLVRLGADNAAKESEGGTR